MIPFLFTVLLATPTAEAVQPPPVVLAALDEKEIATSRLVQRIRIERGRARASAPFYVIFEQASAEKPWSLRFPGGDLAALAAAAEGVDPVYRWLCTGTTLVVIPREDSLLERTVSVQASGEIALVLAKLADAYGAEHKGRGLLFSISGMSLVDGRMKQAVVSHSEAQPAYRVLAELIGQLSRPFDVIGERVDVPQGVAFAGSIAFPAFRQAP
jgi:hypothetical protein